MSKYDFKQKTHLIDRRTSLPRCGHTQLLYTPLKITDEVKTVSCVRCKALIDHDLGKTVYRSRRKSAS